MIKDLFPKEGHAGAQRGQERLLLVHLVRLET